MSSKSYERKTWSKEDNFKLISLYESMPELWNRTHPDYKDARKKQESMKKLIQTFNTNLHEMRRRLHNLRAQFSCELRRLKLKSKRLHVPPAEVTSEWKYFNKLSYLMVNYPHFYNDVFTENLEEDADVSNISIEFRRTNSESGDEKNDSEVEMKPSTSNQMLHKSEEIFIPGEEYQEYQPVIKRNRLSDEDHKIFGAYVASELRNLSENGAQKLKLKIKRAILEVTEEEYNQINGTEYLE